MKFRILLCSIILLISANLYADVPQFKLMKSDYSLKLENLRNKLNVIDFKSLYYNNMSNKLECSMIFSLHPITKKMQFDVEENYLRRVEVLFFGSLTIISFAGWIFFSLFNVMIYDETFGVLRQNQFLLLYLGSSVLSLSIAISDLFIRIRPKLREKHIEIY